MIDFTQDNVILPIITLSLLTLIIITGLVIGISEIIKMNKRKSKSYVK